MNTNEAIVIMFAIGAIYFAILMNYFKDKKSEVNPGDRFRKVSPPRPRPVTEKNPESKGGEKK